MKIIPNDNILPKTIDIKNSQPDPDPAKKNSFNKILEETLVNASINNNKIQKPISAGNLSAIQTSQFTVIDKKSNVQNLEQLIDLIDEYQKKLSNPTYTLKNLDSQVNQMQSKQEELNKILKKLPGSELKELFNHTLVTSSLEIMKFNSGAYN